jgi:hypothetical protein
MAPPPNAKDSQIEPSEPIKTDLTSSLPVVEHSTPYNPITHETGNENLASSSGSNGGRTPSEYNAGQEETIPVELRECDVRQNGIKITRDTKNYHALFSYMLGINTMMPLNNFVGTHTKKHKQFYFERKMWR